MNIKEPEKHFFYLFNKQFISKELTREIQITSNLKELMDQISPVNVKKTARHKTIILKWTNMMNNNKKRNQNKTINHTLPVIFSITVRENQINKYTSWRGVYVKSGGY